MDAGGKLETFQPLSQEAKGASDKNDFRVVGEYETKKRKEEKTGKILACVSLEKAVLNFELLSALNLSPFSNSSCRWPVLVIHLALQWKAAAEFIAYNYRCN